MTNQNNAAQELPDFDTPEVQAVYEALCGTGQPPAGEHWDGWVSRHIVLALSKLRTPVADERLGAQEYGSAADVAQRIEQYLAHDGRMNSGTQLLYEAMKALRASQGDRNDG